MNEKKPQPITEAELQVLKVLWESDLLSAREITEAIYGDPSNSNIATVQKLLQRLERKQCVERDRSRYVHRFSALVTQTHVAGSELEVIAEKVTDGNLVPFISHLVQSKKLSAAEKEEIRRLLD